MYDFTEYARRFERWQQQNPTGDLRSSFHLFPMRPGGLSLEVETMILWLGLLPECPQCHIAHSPEEDERRHSPEFLPPPEEVELRRLWHQGGGELGEELVSSEQKRLMVAQAQHTSPLVLNSGFYQPGTRRFTPDVTARLLRVTDPSIVPVLPEPTAEQLLREDSEREKARLREDSEREKTRADAAEARADAAEARADASDIVVEQLQQRVSELYTELVRSNEKAAQTVAHKDRTIASTTAEWQGKLSGAQQAYEQALQDVKDLNSVDASERTGRIRELEQAANTSAATHAAEIVSINSNHADERQTALRKLQETHDEVLRKLQETHDEVVNKMNGNMAEIIKDMTSARAEAVKAAQDDASQRRQGLVDQNHVLSKEVLRLRASLTSKADEYANNIQNLMVLYQKQTDELNQTKSKAAENKRFLLESYAQSLNFWNTSFREKEQQLRDQLQDKESEVRSRDSQINEIKEQHLAALKVKSDQVTELNEKHVSELKVKDDEIAKLKKQHLSDLKAKDEKHVSELKVKDDEIAKLKKLHLSDLKAKDEKHVSELKVKDDEIAKLKKLHLRELSAKDDQLSELKEQHLRELKAKDDSLTELQRQHVSNLKAKNDEMSLLSAGFQHALQELDKKRLSELKGKDDEIAALKASHLEEMNEVRARHLEEIRTLHCEHLSALTAKEKEHTEEITKLQASHNQAIHDLGKAHGQALETQAEHHFYLREARVIEEQARNMEHLAELAAKDHQLQVANAMHLLAIENLAQSHASEIERLMRSHLLEVQSKEMVLLGRLRENDLQNLQLLREKDAVISQMEDIKQTSVRKFEMRIKFLMLEHQTFTEDLQRQHETSTRDLVRQHETSTQDLVRQHERFTDELVCQREKLVRQHERFTDELICQREESLYELKLEVGRLEEQLDAREEQYDYALVVQANGYEFALVQQANGYEYHIQVQAESQTNLFREALRLERQAHQGIVTRDRGSYLRALAVAEGCHERAIALERDATHLEKQRHFKLMHFCSILGEHVDWLNDGTERLNEENERLQEQVRDGFRFESNMDDLENTVECMETSLLNEFNVVKQVVQPLLTSQTLVDGFEALKNVVESGVTSQALAAEFTALKNIVEPRVTSQALAADFAALKNVVEPRVTSQALAAEFTALKNVVEPRVTSQTLVNDFTALKNAVESRITPQLADNFTALKNMVETRVDPKLADNFTALKTAVESRVLDQTVVDKLDKLKGLVEPNARKMESFGQAMETITTKLDNMPVGGGGADLKEMTAERDELVQQLNELGADPRLEDVPSLDELFEEMGNDKAELKLPDEIKAMGEVDLVGALANAIKRKELDKNNLAGRVRGIQVLCACIDKVDTLRSGSGKPMTSSILKLGQEWIAEPTKEPEVATSRELYTAWHFELSRKVSTLRALAKALKQDKAKKKET